MCFWSCFFCKRDDNNDAPVNCIKTIRYKKSSSFRKANCGNERCTICLEDFNKNEEIQLAPCNHGYHKECLANWLTVKSSCPMCQARLRNEHIDEYTPLVRSFQIDV